MKSAITYTPIGYIECPVKELLRPENIRGLESRLVLDEKFSPAAGVLAENEFLWVLVHLHRIDDWRDEDMPELFKRRIPRRPNPIGLTLVQVKKIEGSVLTVVGMDAVDGTPILDIKPYRPIYDVPPVTPSEDKGRSG